MKGGSLLGGNAGSVLSENQQYVSGRLGKTTVSVTRDGEVSPEQGAMGMAGRSTSIELHPLLTPEEVSRQFARSDRLKRQLIIWAGRHPMMLQRVEYFDTSSPLQAVFAGKFEAA